MKVEIDIDDVAAREIAKLERRVESLKRDNRLLTEKVAARDAKLTALRTLQEAVVSSAYILDEWFGSDD